MKPFWIWRSHADITYQIGVRRVTPVAQAIGLRWRGGGWLWQFPLAVEVEEVTGETRKLPIPDPTRTTVLFLAALALVFVVAAVILRWGRQRVKRERS